MKPRDIRPAIVGVLVAAGLATAWSPGARSQVSAVPSWVPIGVSSSGATSTVWFHEASSRQAAACQTVAANASGLTGIQCVTAKLP